METFLTVLFLIVAAVVVWSIFSVHLEEKNKNKQELHKIAKKVQGHVDQVNNAQTTSTKLKHCKLALEELDGAAAYKEYKSVFLDYDVLVRKLEALETALPAIDHIDKARRHRFKQKDAAEKNALLDALFEIKEHSVTDEDFRVSEMEDDDTGEVITIASVEARLKELGWKPKKQQSA